MIRDVTYRHTAKVGSRLSFPTSDRTDKWPQGTKYLAAVSIEAVAFPDLPAMGSLIMISLGQTWSHSENFPCIPPMPKL